MKHLPAKLILKMVHFGPTSAAKIFRKMATKICSVPRRIHKVFTRSRVQPLLVENELVRVCDDARILTDISPLNDKMTGLFAKPFSQSVAPRSLSSQSEAASDCDEDDNDEPSQQYEIINACHGSIKSCFYESSDDDLSCYNLETHLIEKTEADADMNNPLPTFLDSDDWAKLFPQLPSCFQLCCSKLKAHLISSVRELLRSLLNDSHKEIDIADELDKLDYVMQAAQFAVQQSNAEWDEVAEEMIAVLLPSYDPNDPRITKVLSIMLQHWEWIGEDLGRREQSLSNAEHYTASYCASPYVNP